MKIAGAKFCTAVSLKRCATTWAPPGDQTGLLAHHFIPARMTEVAIEWWATRDSARWNAPRR